jgi:hypothetical protein
VAGRTPADRLGGALILHIEVLGASQQRVFRELGPWISKNGFYLAGGTAIALQLGHRRSVDFDWFGTKDPMTLRRPLDAVLVKPLRPEIAEPGTLTGTVGRVSISLFRYAYAPIRPLLETSDGCLLASLEDLAGSAVARNHIYVRATP